MPASRIHRLASVRDLYTSQVNSTAEGRSSISGVLSFGGCQSLVAAGRGDAKGGADDKIIMGRSGLVTSEQRMSAPPAPEEGHLPRFDARQALRAGKRDAHHDRDRNDASFQSRRRL